MKKPNISKKLNQLNLAFVAERITDLEYAIFFGTLLGFLRGGDIIDGDDDIDFYVNLKHRDKILDIFRDTELSIDTKVFPNLSPYFLQGKRVINGAETLVDFYFYETREEQPYIVERWNFHGRWNDPHYAIHLPNSKFFPLRNEKMCGSVVKTPANAEACCEFLYGNEWRKPLSKNQDYLIRIKNHTPRMAKSDKNWKPYIPPSSSASPSQQSEIAVNFLIRESKNINSKHLIHLGDMDLRSVQPAQYIGKRLIAVGKISNPPPNQLELFQVNHNLNIGVPHFKPEVLKSSIFFIPYILLHRKWANFLLEDLSSLYLEKCPMIFSFNSDKNSVPVIESLNLLQNMGIKNPEIHAYKAQSKNDSFEGCVAIFK